MFMQTKLTKQEERRRRTELTLCSSLLAGLSKFQGTGFKFPPPTTRKIRLRSYGTRSFGAAVTTSEGPASTSATVVTTTSTSRPTTNTWRSQGRRGVEGVTLVLKLFDDSCLGRKRRVERLDVLFVSVTALAPVNATREGDRGVRVQVGSGILDLTKSQYQEIGIQNK